MSYCLSRLSEAALKKKTPCELTKLFSLPRIMINEFLALFLVLFRLIRVLYPPEMLSMITFLRNVFGVFELLNVSSDSLEDAKTRSVTSFANYPPDFSRGARGRTRNDIYEKTMLHNTKLVSR